MSQVRAPKPQKKAPDASQTRRPQNAWTGSRTFSPAPARSPAPGAAAASNGFPPLGGAGANGNNNNAGSGDKTLSALTGLIGTTITLSTRTNQRYEGTVASTAGEGDTKGITLRNVRDLNAAAGAQDKEHVFIAATNIADYRSGPASSDARQPNGSGNPDSFKTDTDISRLTQPRRERELQAWVGDGPGEALGGGGGKNKDEQTFGAGASGGSWDQFAANESLFGVKPTFDEDAYTTKIDRNAADFKERERKAQAIANEIMNSSTNNAHIAEERVMNASGTSGADEEDRYGAVVRAPGAYVPPGARKGDSTSAPAPPSVLKDKDAPKDKSDAKDKETSSVKFAEGTKTTSADAVPKVAVVGPDGSQATEGGKPAATEAFRDFVTNEKQRLSQKRQALVKSEREKRMAELMRFSQSFKLNKPIPDDLVTILAKDEDRQKAIRERAAKDAASAQARAIGAQPPNSKPAPNAAAAPAAPPSTAAPAKAKPKSNMFIQPIPPFKGKKAAGAEEKKPEPAANGQAAPSKAPASAKPAIGKLNVNASSFRPNPNAASFTPTSPNVSQSPLKKEGGGSTPSVQEPPHPFFGSRPLKRQPVQIKDAFNPFHHAKVAEASAITAMWPFNGKRFNQLFPPPAQPPHSTGGPHTGPNNHGPQHVPAPVPNAPNQNQNGPPQQQQQQQQNQGQVQQQQPPQPSQSPMAPPGYDEEAMQAAMRQGYVYAGPYGYYPGQPMMPGMPPPPGAMYPGPYMQPMPYPGVMGVPPPNMYASPQMGTMPPPGAYMQPPPGQYPPPPNGGPGRPSMPPTPIPAHAHPYYHQSPQLQHAMPYQMVMPPGMQPPPPPHGYDQGPPPGPPQQAPPQMGHA